MDIHVKKDVRATSKPSNNLLHKQHSIKQTKINPSMQMKIALQISHETSHGFLYTDKDTDAHIFHYTSTHVSMHAYK